MKQEGPLNFSLLSIKLSVPFIDKKFFLLVLLNQMSLNDYSATDREFKIPQCERQRQRQQLFLDFPEKKANSKILP